MYLQGRYDPLATAVGLVGRRDLPAADMAVQHALARSWPLIEADRSYDEVDDNVVALACRGVERGERWAGKVTVAPASDVDASSVRAALDALGTHERKVVVLHDYLGWSTDRTARVGGMDEASAASLLSRAHEALAPVRATVEDAAGERWNDERAWQEVLAVAAEGLRPMAPESAATGVLEGLRRRRSARRVAAGCGAVGAAVLAVGVAALVGADSQDREPERPAASQSSTSPAASPTPTAVTPVIPPGWQRRAGGPLEPRDGEVQVWTGRELVVWSGATPTSHELIPDGGAYDRATDQWREIADSPLAPRVGAAAVWTGREVLVWGGAPSVSAVARRAFADGAGYAPGIDSWRPLAASPLGAGVPIAVAWTGAELVVVTDSDAGSVSSRFTDAAAYDPVADSWRRIGPLPIVLTYADAVWTGSEVIVFGAQLDSANRTLNPGGLAQGAAWAPTGSGWRVVAPTTLPGTAVSAAWDGAEVIAWEYGLGAEAYDPSNDRWRPLGPLPLDARECYPHTAAPRPRLDSGTGDQLRVPVLAAYCDQAAVRLPESTTWQRVEVPIGAASPLGGAGGPDGPDEPRALPTEEGTFVFWTGEALWIYDPRPNAAPPRVAVPNLVGLTLREAEAVAAGSVRLSVMDGDPVSKQATVIAHEPPAGSSVPAGAVVGLRTAIVEPPVVPRPGDDPRR